MKKKDSINLWGYKIITNKEGIRVSEHRQVWEDTNGKIPKWFSVHHKDMDKLNNKIENLELLDFSEHLKKHRALKKCSY